MADIMDAVIGCIGAVGMCALLVWSGFSMGETSGKRQAVQAFECPLGTVYSVVYTDGSVKCILPRRRA